MLVTGEWEGNRCGHPKSLLPTKYSLSRVQESHVSDVSGPGHPKHVQMTQHSHQYEDRKKRNGKDSMRSSKQPSPKGVSKEHLMNVKNSGRQYASALLTVIWGWRDCTAFTFSYPYVLYLVVFL